MSTFSFDAMMRVFLSKILSFLSVPSALIVAVAVLLPATPRSSTSLLHAKIDKDVLLEETPSPRLILVGGSNLSFGINSEMMADSLGLNPINTAIHASIGLEYMMDSTLDHVKSNDIVIVVPEYSHFFGDYGHGQEELLRTVLDVDRSSLSNLSLNQWFNVVPFIPKLSLSKLKPTEYIVSDNREVGIYDRAAFNRYGDVDVHRLLAGQKVKPQNPITEDFNDKILAGLVKFEHEVQAAGGTVYISFPGLQADSFENIEAQITEVETQLRAQNLLILGTPERYKMSEEFIFNTPYHLTGEGVDFRTKLLIDDLKSVRKIESRGQR